jgi:hypothetical protein
LETEKVRLTKEKETYLITLYGKALDSRVLHVSLPWGINDPHELEKKVPSLRLVTDTPFLFIP